MSDNKEFHYSTFDMADFDDIMRQHNLLVGDFYRLHSEFQQKVAEFKAYSEIARRAASQAEKSMQAYELTAKKRGTGVAFKFIKDSG